MKDCIFCKIVANEIPGKIVAENDLAMAFLDINPSSLGHTLVIPKAHFDNLSSTSDDYLSAVMELAKEVTLKLKKSNLGVQGVNYLSNEGTIAGQVIEHFHLHVIPKYQVGMGLIFKDVKFDNEEINQEVAYKALKEI